MDCSEKNGILVGLKKKKKNGVKQRAIVGISICNV